MADDVQVASTAVDLAQLIYSIGKAIYRCSKEVKDAPAELYKLRAEFDELQLLANILKDSRIIQTQVLEVAFHNQMMAFLDILKELSERTTLENAKGTKRLKWPLKKGETEHYINKAERIKSALNLVITVDQG